MSSAFTQALDQFLLSLMESVHPEEMSPEYAELAASAEELVARLEIALAGNEAADDLDSLCDTLNNMEAISSDLHYRQGFSDGMKMMAQSLMGLHSQIPKTGVVYPEQH